MTVLRLPVPTEHAEQVELFKWAWRERTRHPELVWLYAIPNAGGYVGGFKKNLLRVMAMKREGVKPGYPDVGLDHARAGFHGFRGEMKRRRGGSTTAEQKAWGEHLAREGYFVVRCRGWEEMSVALLEYLALPIVPCVPPAEPRI